MDKNDMQILLHLYRICLSATIKIEYFPTACGGMDNMCTVYDVNNRDASGAAKIVRELAGYEGFLSSCRFLDDTHIVTGSGDMKIMVWDLETGKKTTEMDGHEGDVVIYLFINRNWLKCKLKKILECFVAGFNFIIAG